MAIQSTEITTSPARGDLKPKKTTDHKALRISWTANTVRAILTCRLFNPLRHTRKADIPMRKNRVIHTGPINQPGGVKDGFLRVAYQVGIDGVVKTEPITPAIWQMPMLITSLPISIALVFFIFQNQDDNLHSLSFPSIFLCFLSYVVRRR